MTKIDHQKRKKSIFNQKMTKNLNISTTERQIFKIFSQLDSQ
jgi:predicted patatin/cPLA2 family phospholipase